LIPCDKGAIIPDEHPLHRLVMIVAKSVTMAGGRFPKEWYLYKGKRVR
jgi:hypothetical protein